jgi:hypothetical protein
MENSRKVKNLTANEELISDVTFFLRCFNPPEMEFRHSLTNEIRE